MDDHQRRDIVSKGIAYEKSSVADDLYEEGEEMTFKEKFSLFTQKVKDSLLAIAILIIALAALALLFILVF